MFGLGSSILSSIIDVLLGLTSLTLTQTKKMYVDMHYVSFVLLRWARGYCYAHIQASFECDVDQN